jgi:hypothetical protein
MKKMMFTVGLGCVLVLQQGFCSEQEPIDMNKLEKKIFSHGEIISYAQKREESRLHFDEALIMYKSWITREESFSDFEMIYQYLDDCFWVVQKAFDFGFANPNMIKVLQFCRSSCTDEVEVTICNYRDGGICKLLEKSKRCLIAYGKDVRTFKLYHIAQIAELEGYTKKHIPILLKQVSEKREKARPIMHSVVENMSRSFPEKNECGQTEGRCFERYFIRIWDFGGTQDDINFAYLIRKYINYKLDNTPNQAREDLDQVQANLLIAIQMYEEIEDLEMKIEALKMHGI